MEYKRYYQTPTTWQAFEWPRQATRESNWEAAAQRWAVLHEVYPQHPATWLQAANAHIETGEFEHTKTLLDHARQEFPDHPLSLTESALLAMRKNEWGIAEEYLRHALQKHPRFCASLDEICRVRRRNGRARSSVIILQKSLPVHP